MLAKGAADGKVACAVDMVSLDRDTTIRQKVCRICVSDVAPPPRFTPDQETLALYHFDEGAGDVLTDSSGNGHYGKIIGAK